MRRQRAHGKEAGGDRNSELPGRSIARDDRPGQSRAPNRFTATWPFALRRLSCRRTTRRLPKLRGCRLPVERVIARTVLLQMGDAGESFLDARPMANGHPPQRHRWPVKMLKPIGAAPIEALVHGLPNKVL